MFSTRSSSNSTIANMNMNNNIPGGNNDRLRGLTDRLEARVNSMFHPMQHQQQQQRSTVSHNHYHPHSTPHSPTCHHRNSFNCPCARTHERNKIIRLNQLRANRRDELKSNYRGSMEEFVLKQEENSMKKDLAIQAELQHYNELEKLGNVNVFDNEQDDVYDADYDDDYLESRCKHRSRSPSHRRCSPGKQQDLFGNGSRIANGYSDGSGYSVSDRVVDQAAQDELEQMLEMDRMEIEELTKNLSLEDTY
ncbi:unnamed protein product [Ambrosiozyma monospora]|uniref:Unnamed protein product n=1 Tax=Ambrosiozyma monospora TaxID=43982 RepID=A0ACB5U347_AMBMO|nr:unnamed protein product [Ambrosiozyma monospora]